MTNSTPWRTLASVLLASACIAPFAAAQEAPAADKAGATALTEVIVTAQRRDENQQIVPISVTSVSGKTIEDSGYQGLTDLQYLVPGVQYDPTQGSAFQIRGVGSTSFDFSNEKSVSVVVDDVVMDGQRDNGLTGLEDIARVDVLMGPQGTLFGKNSTSGVIAVTTNNPVLNKWQAKANVSYGERNDRTDNVTVNVPIGSNMALRVTGFDQGQEGFGHYTTLHERLGTVEEYGYRAKLLWRPSDKFEAVFANDYEYHWDTSIRSPVGCSFIATPLPGECPSATVAAAELTYGVNPGPKNADDADGSLGKITTVNFGDSLRIKAKIGADTLTSITAYRGTHYDNSTPADLLPGSVFAYIPYNYGTLSTSKVSQEFRWASPTGQFVEYLGGLFYNRLIADQTQLQWATLGAPLAAPGGTQHFYALTSAIGASGNVAYFQARNETAAAFGQLKFNFTPQLSLALSGRYTYDQNSQRLTYPTVAATPITGTIDTFTATSAQPVYPYGQVVGHNFSYRIAPEYRLTKDVMVYATYSTGYKPAGIAFVGNKYDPFKAETVDSWEIGEKSEWFNHRLRVNIDLFREQFTDFQATILTQIPNGIGGFLYTSAIGNAGGLRSQGVETTFAAKITPNLAINGGVTYTDAVFTNYVYNTTTNYTGSKLTNAPRWQGFIGVDYDHTIGSWLTGRAHLDYAYRSKIWTVNGEPVWSQVEGYGLFNGRLSLTPKNSNFQFGIYGRNLFNTYFSTGWQEYGALGLLHYTSPDAYRTIGVFVKAAY